MKTKKEIIEETVAYYSTDPVKLRSTTERDPNSIFDTKSQCFYFSSNDNCCAVGRCLDTEHPRVRVVKELESKGTAFGEIPKLFASIVPWTGSDGKIHASHAKGEDKYTLDDLLKPEYRGHSIEFWKDLQKLHDCDDFWNEIEISEVGKRYALYLINFYQY